MQLCERTGVILDPRSGKLFPWAPTPPLSLDTISKVCAHRSAALRELVTFATLESSTCSMFA